MSATSVEISSDPPAAARPHSSRRMVLAIAGTATAAMLTASMAALVLRPKPRDPSQPPLISLEDAIPNAFGEWRMVPQRALLVNPQTQELLDKLYSQTLSRTYVAANGDSVMLSLAYGDDQRGGLQAHLPEVCYPAQGFTLHRSVDHTVSTPFGQIVGKRIEASLGRRHEPITYWFAMGDRTVSSKWQRRLVELRLGLSGQAPDGLLFRVSSIDADAERAFRVHERFIVALLGEVRPADRAQLIGELELASR